MVDEDGKYYLLDVTLFFSLCVDDDEVHLVCKCSIFCDFILFDIILYYFYICKYCSKYNSYILYV